METAILSAAKPEEVSEEVSGAVTELENMGLKKLFDPNSQKGGKRSSSSFRLKKRRITRKLKKTR